MNRKDYSVAIFRNHLIAPPMPDQSNRLEVMYRNYHYPTMRSSIVPMVFDGRLYSVERKMDQ
ncbi:hypothetical protein ANCCAN_26369 [Ancylostoma caninum]|uniref:Uncharacterized protein n=1 Tax=Ancylostoma caninum TaxID=29170 RepID=A0A368F6X3_ANCCA|nr:hypothetical protein ANCCAN_26369 [Ancylostoma caninum]